MFLTDMSSPRLRSRLAADCRAVSSAMALARRAGRPVPLDLDLPSWAAPVETVELAPNRVLVADRRTGSRARKARKAMVVAIFPAPVGFGSAAGLVRSAAGGVSPVSPLVSSVGSAAELERLG